MALLSFADSAPRAYWLKVGNAYLTFSTSTGTSPRLVFQRLRGSRKAGQIAEHIVFSGAANHASMIEGTRLNGAED
jgi:7-keto-8-aminopelargonate synthetase-like enzyme